ASGRQRHGSVPARPPLSATSAATSAIAAAPLACALLRGLIAQPLHTGLCTIRPTPTRSPPEAEGWVVDRRARVRYDGAQQLRKHAIDGATGSYRDLPGVSAARLHQLRRRHRGMAAPRYRVAAAVDRRSRLSANADGRPSFA